MINRESGSPLYSLNVAGVWAGIFLCCFTLFLIFIHLFQFMVGHFLSGDSVPSLSHPLNIFERTFNVTGWIFLFFSLMILLNASMDISSSTSIPAKIIKINEVEASFIPTFPLISVSAETDDEHPKKMSIFPSNRYRNHIWEGEFIQVKMITGVLGLPWVEGLDEDQEKMAQAVLKVFPRAVMGWKVLINFYMEHRTWTKLSAAANEYLNLNPADYDLLINVASSLTAAMHDKEALPIYEYVSFHQPNAENFISLGVGLHNTGNNQRSAAILEQAKSLDSKNWEIYYHLGVAYYDLQDWKHSLINFQKVLEFRPKFPQVEGLVADLNGKINASTH